MTTDTKTYLHTDCERLLFRFNQVVDERDAAKELLRLARQKIARLEAALAEAKR